MARKTLKPLHDAVRKIIDEEGWFNYAVYNDKNVKTRKVSYVANGWRVRKKIKDAITPRVEKVLVEQGITGNVRWGESMSWRGPYDRLVVRIDITE